MKLSNGFMISFGVYGFDRSLVKSYNVYEISMKFQKMLNTRTNVHINWNTTSINFITKSVLSFYSSSSSS